MSNIEKQGTAPQMPSLEDKLIRPLCLDYRNADDRRCKTRYMKELGEVQDLLVFTHDPEISRRVFKTVTDFTLDEEYSDNNMLIHLMDTKNLFCNDGILRESMRGIADGKHENGKRKHYINKMFNLESIDDEKREAVMAQVLNDWINSGEYLLKGGSDTTIIQTFVEDIRLNTSLKFVEDFQEKIREIYEDFRKLHLSQKDIEGSNVYKVLCSINMIPKRIE